MPLPPSSSTQRSPTKMLERALSSRRNVLYADEAAAENDAVAADESKTKKHLPISFFTTRITNYLTRTGPVWPCLLLLALVSPHLLPHLQLSEIRLRLALRPGFSLRLLRVRWPRIGFWIPRRALVSKHGKTVEWTSKDLIKGLEVFVPIYETRPIKNNQFGMGFDHSFGLWFIAQWLKPDLMIESGAFKGHSTWVLRQAMPDTPIITLTPRHPEKYLKKGPAYVDGNCTYFSGKDFLDFGSIDWRKLMKKHGITDLSRVLIFFDDHQNELKRVRQALKAGFRHLVFEDNYDTGTGDHYSLRQICDQPYIRGGGHSCFKDSDEARIRSRREKFWEKAVNIDKLCGPSEAWWGVRGYMLDDFNNSKKHFQNSRFVESILDVYWEVPPVAGPSLTHQTRYDPARAVTPVVEDGRYGLFQRLGLTRLDPSVFNGYTQMAYLQISKQ
ncbi:uncharacterized protein Pyn_40522 [Prunus yedoensis var. nudiflora]|uniref:DNA-directed RNA polymerase subunit beta n=1 Tax=Prunus yedoensis var. nudiflora TaxID=2094558 RepID=A0A314XR04_PRUYE|nr:uncharacterized protein Pyn_40522 [Prunus yedoensis var. nudiflora]